MKEIFTSYLNSALEIKNTLLADTAFQAEFEKAAQMLIDTRNKGGTVYACGNGGSACDAMHFTEELIARYKRDRIGMKAMHFLDAGAMTCWSNDYEYEGTFERYADTFCQEGDCLLAISTSGNSGNVNRAVKKAKEKGARSVALCGKGGGELVSLADVSLVVPSDETDRIQEIHIFLIHCFCECLEVSLG